MTLGRSFASRSCSAYDLRWYTKAPVAATAAIAARITPIIPIKCVRQRRRVAPCSFFGLHPTVCPASIRSRTRFLRRPRLSLSSGRGPREKGTTAEVSPHFMDQHQDYQDRTNRVRSLLAAQLEADPTDSDHFGVGHFVFGAAKYGEQGKLGDAIWYVSRDDPLHKRRRLTFEWRAYTPEKIAEALLKVYEELALST